MNPAFVMLFNFIGVALLYVGNAIQQCNAHLVKIQVITKAGLFFIIILLSNSCKTNPEKEIKVAAPEVKIAKTVPPIYKPESDNNFSKHQDTVYYKDQFFTGFRFSLYPNRDTALLQSYFNGVEEGTQKKWYPNRRVQEERFYINGKKEGTHKGWWPDGKEKIYFTTYDDNYEGEFKEWYSSGLLCKYFHYKNGQEEGSQRLWWDNGSVRANYVIREGKKYGLLGLKTCINPYDSINKK